MEKLQKLRFESKVTLASAKLQKTLVNSKLTIKIQEIINGDINNRREVLQGKFEADLDEQGNDFKFPFLQITTDLLSDGGNVSTKILVIQIIECYQEKNKKTKEFETLQRVFGEAIVCIKDLVEHGRCQELLY